MGPRHARHKPSTQEATYSNLYEYFSSIDSLTNIPVVTLEQAIAPLTPLLPTILTYARLVKEKCERPADGLTSDESASIMLYSMAWEPLNECLYVTLNTALRSMQRRTLEPWSLFLKLLLTAVLRLQSSQLIVYRENSLDLSEQYKINEKFTWWDFSLCATSIDWSQPSNSSSARQTRTMFVIESHTVKDIRRHTYLPTDNSVLILPGTQFEVLTRSNEDSNLWSITLHEIQSSFLLRTRAAHRRSKTFFHMFCLPSKKSCASSDSPPPPENYRNVSLEQQIAQSDGGWTVDLDEQWVTDRDMKLVVSKAIVRKRCKRIRLRDNHITSQGALILAEGLHHNVLLESLDLRNNRIGDVGVQALASAIAQSNLKTLNLESNQITCEGATFLAQMLRNNRTLTELYLSKNQLGNRGVELLANVLHDERRRRSEQDNRGVSASRSSTLQHLYLGQNEITDTGVEYLAEMLKSNRMLTWLWLSGNEIGNRGVELLANTLALYNFSLEWLFLNSNKAIDDGSLEALILMLRQNHSLKTIYLNNCSLSDAAKTKLQAMTKFKKDFDLEV